MRTSRQRILDYIRVHRAATTAELCKALLSSEANLRRHLNILIEQDLVAVIDWRPADGKGRPARVYGLSPRILGSNLDLLTGALLDEIEIKFGPVHKAALLEGAASRLGSSLAAKAPPQPPAADHLSARLYAVVAQLNQAHYEARWEARSDAPRLILGHCPFASVVAGHPEICRMDAHLLAELVGRPVEQLKRLQKDARGNTYCLFRVGSSRLTYQFD